MPIYQIDGLTPVVPEESYVHPTAVLIGDVILGKGVYVGPNASLRGDFGRIVVKDGANIQDNCVMHGFPRPGYGGGRGGPYRPRRYSARLRDWPQRAGGHERGDYRRGGHWRKQHCRRFGLCQSQRRDARQPSDYRQPGKSDSHPERTGAGVEKQGTREYQALVERCKQTLHQVEPLREVEAGRKRLAFDENLRPKAAT